jgi:hypothetical protein
MAKTFFGGANTDQPVVSVCPECKALTHGTEPCPICRRPSIMPVTMATYLGQHKDSPELNALLRSNAAETLQRANSLLERLLPLAGTRTTPAVTSGFRPVAWNLQIGGSANSWHCQCLAIDLLDPQHKLGLLLRNNQQLLAEAGLYMEQLEYCQKPSGFWVHLQCRAPKSNLREFQPYPGPPKN